MASLAHAVEQHDVVLNRVEGLANDLAGFGIRVAGDPESTDPGADPDARKTD